MTAKQQITRPYANHFSRLLQGMFDEHQIRGGTIGKAKTGARHLAIPVCLNHPGDLRKSLSMSDELAAGMGVRAVITTRENEWIVYQVELPQTIWETYTRQDLLDAPDAIGVGLGAGRTQISLNWYLAPHVLIAGATRVAGKSVCLHSILTGLMTTYTPAELQVLLIDPRNDCEDLHNARHLIAPPATTSQEAAAAIDIAVSVFKDRSTDNNRNAPQLVVAIDEAQNIVPAAQRQDELAMLGQEFGKFQGHLIIATQKPLEAHLPGLLFNLGHRLVGQVPTARDSAMLTGRRELHAELLTPHGDFLYVAGDVETRLQVAMATPDDVAEVMKRTNGRNTAWPGLEGERRAVDDTLVEKQIVDVGGRPLIAPQPELVARYLWAKARGASITEDQARTWLGLKRTGHQRNRDFARGVHAELRRLHAANTQASV